MELKEIGKLIAEQLNLLSPTSNWHCASSDHDDLVVLNDGADEDDANRRSIHLKRSDGVIEFSGSWPTFSGVLYVKPSDAPGPIRLRADLSAAEIAAELAREYLPSYVRLHGDLRSRYAQSTATAVKLLEEAILATARQLPDGGFYLQSERSKDRMVLSVFEIGSNTKGGKPENVFARFVIRIEALAPDAAPQVTVQASLPNGGVAKR